MEKNSSQESKSCSIYSRPLIIRPPVFIRGKTEIPIIGQKFEKVLIPFIKIIENICYKLNIGYVLSESYIIYIYGIKQ